MYRVFLLSICLVCFSGCSTYNQMALTRQQSPTALNDESMVLLVVETSWENKKSKSKRSIPAIQSVIVEDAYGVKQSYKVGKENNLCKSGIVKQVISLPLKKGSYIIKEFSGDGLMCTESKGNWYTTPSGKFTQKVNTLIEAASGQISYAGHMNNYLSRRVDNTNTESNLENKSKKLQRNRYYPRVSDNKISDQYHEDMALINSLFPKLSSFDVINTLFRPNDDDLFNRPLNE